MDDRNPPNEVFDAAPSASLLSRIGAHARNPTRNARTDNAGARLSLRPILLAIGLAAGATMLGALWQMRLAQAETRTLIVQGEASGRDREQAEEMARALAKPPLDAVLASLRAHLPRGMRLIEAARGEDGILSLAIDTPDPDALRAALSADSRLGAFASAGRRCARTA
jgi:hypothetical protein